MRPSPAPGPRRTGRWRAATLAGVVAVACAAVPSSAQAMFDGPAYAFPVPDYVSGLIGNSALTNTYDQSGGGKGGSGSSRTVRRAAPRPPTARQFATLRYRATPAVTSRIHEEVVRRSGSDPAVVIPQFETTIADWRRVLTRVIRWRANDLGDTAAFTFLQGYIVANDASPRISDRGAALLRRAVRANLAGNATIRRLSDGRKQEAAEMLELRMIFFFANVQALTQAGDTAGAARERRAARDWVEEIFDVDVTETRLTRRGLVRR